MTEEKATEVKRPDRDASASAVWAYIEALEHDMVAVGIAGKKLAVQLRQTNHDLAKHTDAAQERERDHRRKFIELAAIHAMPEAMGHAPSVPAAITGAVEVAFGLWAELDGRFEAEQQEKQGEK